MVWQSGWKISQLVCIMGQLYEILKKRMESDEVWHVMQFSILIIVQIHYKVIITTIKYDRSGSEKEKSVRIRWNLSRHESHQIMFVIFQTIKLFNIRLWDTGQKNYFKRFCRNVTTDSEKNWSKATGPVFSKNLDSFFVVISCAKESQGLI